MNFIKTQKLLSQQIGQTEIPLESVLELLRTYLTELRYHTNTPVDRCRIGNMSQMVASLAAVTNDILFVYRTNEKDIHAIESRFTLALDKAHNACSDYHSRITALDEQIRQEEAGREQLESLLKQEKLRSAELARLQQNTADLQAQIDALSVTDPATKAGKLQALLESQTDDLARVTGEYNRMQQEQEQVQKQLEKENARLAQLRTEVDADHAKLNETVQIIKDQQEIRKELEQEYCRLDHQLVTLKDRNDDLVQAQYDLREKIEEAQATLDQQQEQYDRRQDALATRIGQLEALKVQYAQDETAAQKLEAQYAALEKEHSRLQSQIANREEENRNVRVACDKCETTLIAIQSEQEQLKRQLDEFFGLEIEEQKNLEQLKEQVVQKEQANSTLTENVRTWSDQLSVLEGAHQEKTAQLAQLNSDIQQLEQELRQMQEETSLRRTQIAATEEALCTEKTDFDCLLEQLVSAQVELEAQKIDNENFRAEHLAPAKEQLAALVLDARRDQDQRDDIRNSIKQLDTDRASLAKEIAILMVNRKAKQSKLDSDRYEYDQIRTTVSELEEQLKITGAESAALLEREKELRELLDEKNVARITTELKNSIQRLENTWCKVEQDERDLAEKKQQQQKLQQQLDTVQAELETCTAQQNDLLSRHKKAAWDLNQITCEENRQRCRLLQNQLLAMQAMTERLVSPATQPCGEGFSLPKHLKDRIDQAQSTVDALRSVIREYTTLRQNALETTNNS